MEKELAEMEAIMHFEKTWRDSLDPARQRVLVALEHQGWLASAHVGHERPRRAVIVSERDGFKLERSDPVPFPGDMGEAFDQAARRARNAI
ncbi:hypothetical protein E7T09_18940 [Deinococcus sp. KSM4-11]|uniref:hypothetical protein n=1 Tax=Deinococcus sp. KSM4-11 TaxID=2568654 RepID=UPI0010A3074F|nr:hypothetical protein [Deinococcus sp. KSM4-11]THF85101.1 hypothetical protein E7T09_18940 [Deinococcus sp. KSM4-11]